MTPADHSLELKAAIATASTYATSGTLVAGSYMDYLNTNAGACGVILGIITFVFNAVFQFMNRRALLIQLDKKEDL